MRTNINTMALLGCVGLCGGVAHAQDGPTLLSPSVGQVRQAAHIYYNVATGERVVTVLADS